MEEMKFIKHELESKCYGKINVEYSDDFGFLYVVIETDIIYRYKKEIDISSLAGRQALTEIVKIIKLDYIEFLMDKYFK